MEKHIETCMGIEIFSWDGWDEVDGVDIIQFYNVEFLLPELVKYDNADCVCVSRKWNITIYTDSEEDESIEFNLGEIDSFREQLNKKYNN